MRTLLAVIILVFLCSCEGEEDRMINCTGVSCVADYFTISYQDSLGNPLIGKVFVQDSFKLSTSNSTIYIKPLSESEPENLAIYYGTIEGGAPYSLELSPTESDALNFVYATDSDSCCVVSTMQTFRYNGDVIIPQSNNFYLLIR